MELTRPMWEQKVGWKPQPRAHRPVFTERLCSAPGLCLGLVESRYADGFVEDETLLSGDRVQQQTHVTLGRRSLQAAGRPGGKHSEGKKTCLGE